MCTQRRLRSAWASAQSDQCLRCPHEETWVLSYPLSTQQRRWLDWADAQSDLSLCWALSHFVGFCHEAAHIVFIFIPTTVNTLASDTAENRGFNFDLRERAFATFPPSCSICTILLNTGTDDQADAKHLWALDNNVVSAHSQMTIIFKTSSYIPWIIAVSKTSVSKLFWEGDPVGKTSLPWGPLLLSKDRHFPHIQLSWQCR